MAKYRKIPVIIDAEQWFPGKTIKGLCGCIAIPGAEMHRPHVHNKAGGRDVALNLTTGDYVITGVEGEMYPCKESVFKKTYEEVQNARQVHSS
jgi:hypothetical protein